MDSSVNKARPNRYKPDFHGTFFNISVTSITTRDELQIQNRGKTHIFPAFALTFDSRHYRVLNSKHLILWRILTKRSVNGTDHARIAFQWIFPLRSRYPLGVCEQVPLKFQLWRHGGSRKEQVQLTNGPILDTP
jgi:hypothetical protein